MVTDEQVRKLMDRIGKGDSLSRAALKAGMDEKTARKYRRLGRLPSEMRRPRTWRTRGDPFEEVWDEIREKLEDNAGFEATTLFTDLQRRYPGRFSDGQLRTLQRRVKAWRALEGPGKEVFFPQDHHPGRLSQSDFTRMGSLGIMIDREPFPHLVYHFVLTYSNWETGTVCFSESYESLSDGLQRALWELGAVPRAHQTDQLTAAVHPLGREEREEFTRRYQGLLAHYGLEGRKSRAGKANELGDAEQRHHRFKRAVEQALLLRGSRDFGSREEYEGFLRHLFRELNAGRRERLEEERKALRPLPAQRVDDCKRIPARVGPASTIHIQRNTYTVHSRLIGEYVDIRLYAEVVEVWYAQRCVERLPRLRGEGKFRVDYRHIIDWLVRKPGAFENYRYKADLFPSSHFRMAYDSLGRSSPSGSAKAYLRILHLAAQEGEMRVEEALRFLIQRGEAITPEGVEALVKAEQVLPAATEIGIDAVDLASYDDLVSGFAMATGRSCAGGGEVGI